MPGLAHEPEEQAAPELPVRVQRPALPAAPEPPADEASAGASATGARGYLLRKMSDELQRFQPVVEALRQREVLSEDEIGRASRGGGNGSPDDDEVSVESFVDDRPRGDEIEAELSPMKLVEEIRRLKRITDALVRKGVLSQEDLSRSLTGD